MPNQIRSALALLIVMIVMFVSLTVGNNDGKTTKVEDAPTYSEIQHSAVMLDKTLDWGLTMKAEDVSKTGLTLTFEQVDGAVTGELSTGAEYSLDKLENSKWIVIDYADPEADVAWTQEAYMIKTGDTTSMDIDWTNIYGELKPGSYRVVKMIQDFRGAGDMDTNAYFAYFTIQ